MQRNSAYDDLIERYLDGTLPKVEKELFDERLKTDQILAKKFANRIMLQKYWVKVEQHKRVKQRINRLINTEKKDHKVRSNIWLFAASIVVLIGISSLFFFRNKQNQNDREFLSASKSLNKDNSEKFIKGQNNEIKKFGSIDSVKTNNAVINRRYLPLDGAVYQTSDTILFIWPATNAREKLVIFDENGAKVFEVSLQTGIVEYKLLPSMLKPGAYSWILPHGELNNKFSIK